MKSKWEMWVVNPECEFGDRIEAGADSKKLTDAQRRFEIWIDRGSPALKVGMI